MRAFRGSSNGNILTILPLVTRRLGAFRQQLTSLVTIVDPIMTILSDPNLNIITPEIADDKLFP